MAFFLPSNRKSGQIQILWVGGYWRYSRDSLGNQGTGISYHKGMITAWTRLGTKKEHSSLHRSCHQWVKDIGDSPGVLEIWHKSVSPPGGSSPALPVSEWEQEVRHHAACRWKTLVGMMKADRGKGKVNVTMKFFINFWHISCYCNSKGNNLWTIFATL